MGMALEDDVLAHTRGRGLRLMKGRPLCWLTSRGHLDPLVQANVPGDVIELLDDLHESLGGDRHALAHKPRRLLSGDLVVAHSGQIIELDEVQHFTAARLDSLEWYPGRGTFGFSIDHYRRLIDTWWDKAHTMFTRQWAADFDFGGGRRAQRAYLDTLKDLLAPVFTGAPVLRVAVPDGDARRAGDLIVSRYA